jgi:hypothetical protein
MAFDVTTEEVTRLFSPFGIIQKIDMSKDSTTGGSKGYCFIWFQDAQSAIAAHSMDGFQLGERSIKVGAPSELLDAGKAGQAELDSGAPIASFSAVTAATGSSSLSSTAAASGAFVLLLNVPAALTTTLIASIVGSFGKVLSCLVVPTANTLPTAHAVSTASWTAQVQFTNVRSVYSLVSALNLNGLLLCGALVRANALAHPVVMDGGVVCSDGKNAQKASPASFPSSSSPSSSSSKTEEGRANAHNNNARTRVALANMVTLEEALSDTHSLKQEIATEAATYGVLLDISIVKRTRRIDSDGNDDDHHHHHHSGSGEEAEAVVYLTYEDEAAAERAWTVLNGRFFGKRTIVATVI